jgi:hypothetical protein
MRRSILLLKIFSFSSNSISKLCQRSTSLSILKRQGADLRKLFSPLLFPVLLHAGSGYTVMSISEILKHMLLFYLKLVTLYDILSKKHLQR